MNKQQLIWILLVLLFTGCTVVGPNYQAPENSLTEKWSKPSELPGPKVADTSILSSWWTVFNDKLLSELVEASVDGGLSVKEAQARVREARARKEMIASRKYPSLDGSGAASASKSSKLVGGGTNDLYKVGLDASWELDLFGGLTREIEAAQADFEASEEDLHDAIVSLSGEVAYTYIELRTLQNRLVVAEDNLSRQKESYDLASFKSQAGLGNGLELEQARYSLENTRAGIPDLEDGIQQAKNRLAVLGGLQPGALDAILEGKGAIPNASQSIAIGIPAEVIRRRPDVRQAERTLAAETARIGVATADLYPKFALSGSVGFDVTSPKDLLSIGNRALASSASVSWNVFDSGAIRKNIEIRSAVQEQALIQYESSVLQAAEEVENAFVSYAKGLARGAILKKAANSAEQAVKLAVQQYQSGTVDYSDVLETERSLQSFQDQLVVNQGNTVAALVRLYKAAGGGWSV